jgi:outer membrane protein insertion porin family
LANSYISYGTKTMGFSPRLRFTLREDLSLQLRYSIYQQEIRCRARSRTVTTIPPTRCSRSIRRRLLQISTASARADRSRQGPDRTDTWPGPVVLQRRRSFAAGPRELQSGKALTSSVGYSLNYNTLDNNKNPTDGLLIDWKQDFAGVGGDVKYIKSAIDAKYYTPLVADIVGLIHLRVACLTSSAAASCACSITSRWARTWFAVLRRTASVRAISARTARVTLGGTKYWGASFELQMPFWFLPKKPGSRARSMPTPAVCSTTKARLRGRRRVRSTCPVACRRRRRRRRLGQSRNLFGIAVRQRQCGPHFGRCRPHLGLAVWAATL